MLADSKSRRTDPTVAPAVNGRFWYLEVFGELVDSDQMVVAIHVLTLPQDPLTEVSLAPEASDLAR